MDRTIQINGREVKFRATAAVLRYYRLKFQRDIISDLSKLEKALKKTEDGEEQLSTLDLTIFENVAYIMAKLADPENIPPSVEEWLDGFEIFSIYEILPEIMELWTNNMQTLTQAKKNPTRRRAH